MFTRRKFLGVSASALLSGCGDNYLDMSKVYDGPPVTHVEVLKSQRQLILWGNGEILRRYEIDLGFAPEGPKRFEGDGKTPEGTYFINRRNPESRFFLSLGISYPNRRDKAYARKRGRSPGSDIFIHGQVGARIRSATDPDWTAGCIALKNSEMREVYWMVRLGTPITIRP